MYKKVVIKAFNKAKEDIFGRSNKTSQSEHISNALLENFKFQISSRTLRNLYDDAIKKNDEEDISISSDYVQNLCQYLGFENYNEFLKEHADGIAEPNVHNLLGLLKKNKIVLAISILTVIIILSVSIFNKQRWMIWDDTHYVEVDFDAKKHSLGKLKLYNSDYIEHFFKVDPDCSTQFFNTDGSVNLWYGKNIAGELEYFSAIAMHPETGKTLKEITVYMIKKHICDNY
jgi:hypothetical protein